MHDERHSRHHTPLADTTIPHHISSEHETPQQKKIICTLMGSDSHFDFPHFLPTPEGFHFHSYESDSAWNQRETNTICSALHFVLTALSDVDEDKEFVQLLKQAAICPFAVESPVVAGSIEHELQQIFLSRLCFSNYFGLCTTILHEGDHLLHVDPDPSKENVNYQEYSRYEIRAHANTIRRLSRLIDFIPTKDFPHTAIKDWWENSIQIVINAHIEEEFVYHIMSEVLYPLYEQGQQALLTEFNSTLSQNDSHRAQQLFLPIYQLHERVRLTQYRDTQEVFELADWVISTLLDKTEGSSNNAILDFRSELLIFRIKVENLLSKRIDKHSSFKL